MGDTGVKGVEDMCLRGEVKSDLCFFGFLCEI